MIVVREPDGEQVHRGPGVLALPGLAAVAGVQHDPVLPGDPAGVGVDELHSVQGAIGGVGLGPGKAAVGRRQDLAAVADDDDVVGVDGLHVVELIGDPTRRANSGTSATS